MRVRYGRQRDALIDALARELPEVTVTGIAAGLHVNARLPASDDEQAIQEEAGRRGIIFSTTREYRSDSHDGPPTLMLGYGIGARAGHRRRRARDRRGRARNAHKHVRAGLCPAGLEFKSLKTTPVTIPDFQTLMRPTLEQYADGLEHRVADVRQSLATAFALSSEEIAERLPSGKVLKFNNRCGWATSYLNNMHLLERRGRGLYRITARGSELLLAEPTRIDLSVLAQYPELEQFRGAGNRLTEGAPLAGPVEVAEATPSELIEAAAAQLRGALIEDLKTHISSQTPDFFEVLVLDVLTEMGYGGSREDAAKRLGRSGDGGIDGVIREDRLGLDQIYVQAKRWERSVGRPEVQAFVGALQGVRASRGVMITTSTFSREARDYAESITPRVVLLDGEELADLMVEHDVGVSVVNTYAIKRVDSDYFADAEDA